MIQAPRHPFLRPFVETLWFSEPGARSSLAEREWVLPTGAMHVVLRLSGPKLRLFHDLDDRAGFLAGPSIVGGARSRAYLRDISQPVVSIGAQLRPGVAQLLFDLPGDELAERHSSLDDLLGIDARLLRERLLEAGSPSRKLSLFEAFFASRLEGKLIDPIVAHALTRIGEGAQLRAIVTETGYSHRHFLARFQRAVGLPPKLYARILRFQRALRLMPTSLSLTRVALAAGYSDQPHFTREFRELSGLAPGQYRAFSPMSPNHVEVVNSFQDARR